MDVLTLSKLLKHYKRQDIQQAIVESAHNKEAVGSYGGKGYGKRPDTLSYPNDVFSLVRTGVTSFHVSEEIWSNPQSIQINMKKSEYDQLRQGWDLVLDIDCPQWEFAKITTWLFIRALEQHRIRSITCKFSGNKGFHIGVPFEAFPPRFRGQDTKDLFPEGPRKIASYLLQHISDKQVKVKDDKIVFGDRFEYTIKELADKTCKNTEEFVIRRCMNCGKKIRQEPKTNVQFICRQCQKTIDADKQTQYMKCPTCNILMERTEANTERQCCSNPDVERRFDPATIVEVDTVLIAPRHLYRAPYSYHEKSGLISIPINPSDVLDFEKVKAEPAAVRTGQHPFLKRDSASHEEGVKLLMDSFEYEAKKEQKAEFIEDLEKKDRADRDFEEVQTAIPEQFFPPCIQAISKGLKDGRKRAVFIMTNFLSSCGWDYDSIEEWFREWNQKHDEPLREQYYQGQVRYAKRNRKKILPPNCDNEAYYKSFGMCKPDNFCRYIKNPANYAIKRARHANKREKPKKKPENTTKTDEPKSL